MELRKFSENNQSSFLHHQKGMIKLDWFREPFSVSIFIQNSQDQNVDINLLKDFLFKTCKLKVTENHYTNEDFIILVGTDSFNLNISLLFQNIDTPPILSLSPKKKGFISFLDFKEFSIYIPQILRGNCWIMPRSRLEITYKSLQGKQRLCVLNDVSVNRDPSGGSLILNCSCNEFGFSQINGDGIIIATPTGSTAYNKGAGGALVHPLLPVFQLTPICALSLSARPILFPHTAILTISIANQNGTKKEQQKAYLSFDGQKHIQFNPGEELIISLSTHTYNSIMMNKSVGEWPIRLAGLMGWNERKHQKPLSTDTLNHK